MSYLSSTLLSLFVCLACYSSLAASAPKEEITIGVSFSIPPWVIQKDDAGIELDILRASFQESNVDLKLLYAPFSRIHRLFEQGKIDGFINAKSDPNKAGYLSDIVVTFQNVAVSLKQKNFPQDINLKFLRDKQVVAFQRASDYLGERFKLLAESNDRYQEVANQMLQINLLFMRGVDFIVMDKSIFGYFWQDAINKNQNNPELFKRFQQEVTIHPLFPKSDYAFRFLKESVRDEFNRGLKRIKDDGTYARIFEQYDKLRDLYKRGDR